MEITYLDIAKLVSGEEVVKDEINITSEMETDRLLNMCSGLENGAIGISNVKKGEF